MCQLTYIDSKISLSRFVPALLAWNSENNPHGFGMNLNNIPLQVTTWGDDFVTVFNNKKGVISEHPLYGIFHVRLATVRVKQSDSRFSHPFVENDLIFAHNGTLRSNLFGAHQFKTLLSGDLIDSQEFLKILSHYKGNKLLTPEIFSQAMHHFSGTFAFLIRESSLPNQITAVRGWTKPLHYAIIKNSGKNVGFVINTQKYNLKGWLDFVCTFYKNLTYEIKLFDKESIYNYQVNSYEEPTKIGELIETSAEKPKVVTHTYPAFPAQTYTTKRVPDTVVPKKEEKSDILGKEWLSGYDTIKRIIEKADEYNLTVPELSILSELLFGKSIYSLTNDEMKKLYTLINSLAGFAHTDTKNSWVKVLLTKEIKSVPEFYRKTGLAFPYLLNSSVQISNLVDEKGVK